MDIEFKIGKDLIALNSELETKMLPIPKILEENRIKLVPEQIGGSEDIMTL